MANNLQTKNHLMWGLSRPLAVGPWRTKSVGVLSHCKNSLGHRRMETQVVFVTMFFTFFNKVLNPLVYITRYDVLRGAWLGLFERIRAKLENEQPTSTTA